MEIKYSPNANYHSKLSTQKIMLRLFIGLIVVYAFGLVRGYLLGKAYFVNAIILLVVALACSFLTEIIFALVTKKDVKTFISSSFPLITPTILVLTCSYDTSPYAIGVATVIAVFFGKLAFGGFGQNVFNPAAVGRAIIGTSFAGSKIVDVMTGATPTATLCNAGWLLKSANLDSFLENFGGLKNLWFGFYNGSIGETSTILLLLVAIYFGITKVIDIFVPIAYIGVIFFGTALIGIINGVGIKFALTFIATGGIAFAGTFMLTDPVTDPNTRIGRIVFGSLAALFTILIRFFANLPEGVVFSILLANMLVPVIEKVCETNLVAKEKQVNIFATVFMIVILGAIVLCGSGLTMKRDYIPVETENLPVEEEIIDDEAGASEQWSDGDSTDAEAGSSEGGN